MNIVLIEGIDFVVGYSYYVLSKVGFFMLMCVVVLEFGEYGVCVNVVLFGLIY